MDDHGTTSEAPADYPPICIAVGRTVAEGRADRGIVLGGSGQGEQMAANKVPGVRAALCNDLYTARLSREHNDANVLSMGGRIVAFGLADEILDDLADHARSKADATSAGSIRSPQPKGRGLKAARGAPTRGLPWLLKSATCRSGARSQRAIPRSRRRSPTSCTGRTAGSS